MPSRGLVPHASAAIVATMKSAKIAMGVALAMTVLNSGRCVVALVFAARSLIAEEGRSFQKAGEMQTLQEQLQAVRHEAVIHQFQTALYGWSAALAWNLVLAGLLIFAVSRIRKSN